MHDRSLKIVGIGVVAAVVISTAVMLLWNALLPDIFGIKNIGFFQALGLLVLCKILFGGIGGRGWFGRHGREMRERWMTMSPEERETFIRQRGFGHGFRRGHGCWSREDRHGHHDSHGRCTRDLRGEHPDTEIREPRPDVNDQKPANSNKQD